MNLLECEHDIHGERDVVDLIGAAFGARPDWIVIPVARLGEGYLDLKTRLLGEALQKFANFDLRVAIEGDVSRAIAESRPFADFVRECNRGTLVWFVADRAALLERLG